MTQTPAINITLSEEDIELLKNTAKLLFEIAETGYNLEYEGNLTFSDIDTDDIIKYSTCDITDSAELLTRLANAKDIHWKVTEY